MRPATSLLGVYGSCWKQVRYGSTTRAGGVSSGEWGTLNLGMNTDDAPERVLENRRLLTAQLPAEPLWLRQVHGVEVCDADTWNGDTESGVSEAPVADAAVTTTPGRVLAVLTADCAPVVIADAEGRALGVAHAGWRGLAAGVLDATLKALRTRVPGPAKWCAWVGPCIGQARFEVGEDVRSAFVVTNPEADHYFMPGAATGKWQADLAGLVEQRLRGLGVQQVETSGLCTYDRADLFYSYRRNKTTGRLATIAWLQA